MNQREKVLSIAIVALLVIVGGQMTWSRIRRGIALKEGQVEALEKEIKKKQREIKDGILARDDLQRLSERSLPARKEFAEANYKEWLTDVAEEVGLADLSIKQLPMVPEKGVFDRHEFTLNGIGTIEQAVKLLYLYHEKDYLHRVKTLDLKETKDAAGNMLNIVLASEVLALNMAKPNQPAPSTLSNRTLKTLDDYRSTIIERNVFAGPNSKPNLETVARTSVPVNGAMSYQIKASDKEGQELEYSLLGESPEGLKIDKRTGKVLWNPKKLGKTELLVRAKDNGIPSRYSDQTLTIEVVDPPAPPKPPAEPPSFNVASQSFVSALVSGREGPEAWVKNRAENKTTFVKIGDSLEVGEIKGKVIAIGANYMEVETDGKRWIVGQDESLADAFQRGKVD
jgi:hypothetical protein